MPPAGVSFAWVNVKVPEFYARCPHLFLSDDPDVPMHRQAFVRHQRRADPFGRQAFGQAAQVVSFAPVGLQGSERGFLLVSFQLAVRRGLKDRLSENCLLFLLRACLVEVDCGSGMRRDSDSAGVFEEAGSSLDCRGQFEDGTVAGFSSNVRDRHPRICVHASKRMRVAAVGLPSYSWC